jgi:hypothetical protein
VIGRVSVLDAAFGCTHCLLREPQEPQNPRKVDARRYPLVDVKANNVRSVGKRDIVGEHVLDMAPRAGLVAQKMFRHTEQSVADQAIVRV